MALRALIVVLGLTVPALALAEGRTDGPEGSEIGQGGYEELSGRWSLQLDWGAALASTGALSGNSGAPLFAGLTGSWWADDWIAFDASGQYVLRTGTINALVGPRFRSTFWPVAASAGLKAGAMIVPNAGVRFGLSPQVGVDATIKRHFLLGLDYALDIPLGTEGYTHRIFMHLGYRF